MSEESDFGPGVSGLPEALHQAGDLLEVGVLTTDAELVVRGWNRWLEATSGRSATEVVGRPLLEVFPELAGSRAEAAFQQALSGETVVFAHRFHRYLLPLPPVTGYEDFERMQQSARIAPLLQGERVTGVIALIQDVTERVAREEELKRAVDRLEEASQAKSDFLAAMSHELRTPLNGMIGYSDLLLHEISGPLLGVQKQQVERIQAGARHLVSIIEEILTFSRVEAGKEEVQSELFDCVQVARDAAALLEPQAAGKSLRFRISLPEQPVEVESDARKLRQILLNLLGNAVKFTDTGEVELRLWTEGDRALCAVRDTGPGIPPEDLDRIFEPFTRLGATRARAKAGTGLGLPVSRKLAHLLGGELRVESVPAGGSCFTLEFPLRHAPRPPADPPSDGVGAASGV